MRSTQRLSLTSFYHLSTAIIKYLLPKIDLVYPDTKFMIGFLTQNLL